MKRSPRRERERGSNIEPIELLLDRPRPAPVERRCCCTPRSLAKAVRCFHCLARRGLQQFRRTRSAPPTPRDEEGGVISCVEIKMLRCVRAESSRRPLRHRRDACSIAWWCSFLTARPSQDGRVIAEK